MYVRWITFVFLSFPFVNGDRSVRTTTGRVRSTAVELPNGEEVEAFLGIPYAEPPLGKLRFERPVPIRPWEGEFNATVLPPPCYQNYTFKYYWTPNVERMTEDCLYLNIWVPGSIQDTKPKVVFVWIHGGAFNIGSTEMDVYNGALLASRGNIIVISMNYRVGIFGFLTTSIPGITGNMGMYDQVLACKWIKANVEAFGGDPESITLAGESAGAMAASLFLLSPMTRGFAKRIILQSGGVVHPMSEVVNHTMSRVAEQVSRKAGCSNKDVNMTSNPRIVVDCLKRVPPNVISEAEGYVMKIFPITATPVPDNELVPRNPTDMLLDGDYQETEVLIGCNKDEGSNFLVFVAPEYFGIYGVSAPVFKKRLTGYVIRTIFSRTEQKNTTYIAKHYVEGGGHRKLKTEDGDDSDVDYMKIAIYDSIGDYMILCPTVFQAEIMSSRRKPVYFYMFTHRPTTTLNADWMGVAHFDEVGFVFGRPLMGDKNYTEDEKEISGRMMDRWIAFAKTGNPNVEGTVQWPPYRWNNPVYLDINVEEKVKTKPDDYRCEFWRDRYRVSQDYFKSDSLTDHGTPSSKMKKESFFLVAIFVVLLVVMGN